VYAYWAPTAVPVSEVVIDVSGKLIIFGIGKLNISNDSSARYFDKMIF
jgi:hypothetical protein